ncbi:glyoxylase-like metal-dependent hydrolase (beta-lactamase superfamily II) [Neolewinella xylanilytica]|uniref:Glyoxylase-like metal-dependent hydrolase (Beta-lactamase superfamily II) n=1 Tax=Neolewinella xylanilytica TaxID=1514080 RepID=A0A2S6IA15_9BACT|nr:rhodanese-like domain-containing protein [Neolewinella xylanilytica]PPK88347.1 glyoxylase-like metal-dependent hydrolase (beta-lactamase superfamily II) [Neolewinella xylanilytica]
MSIKQFYDEGLAHASYIVYADNEAVVIDPARDSQPYYDYLGKTGTRLTAIIETHPHADFVSAHLEMHGTTDAPILTSGKTGAGYPHRAFNGEDTFSLGDHTLTALDTPGHSPDSICILLTDASGKQLAVFTGDTLFVGDVGRPDLRESGGEAESKKERLARAMYHSLRDKLMPLDPGTEVYPAHGAGSLCGKGLSDERSSTIGKQLKENPALQAMTEAEFVEWLLADQPFVPQYFPYNVEVNKQGAPNLQDSLADVRRETYGFTPEKEVVVVDTRDEATFKLGHLPGALNIQDGGKFETWLGAMVAPRTPYYLVAKDEKALEQVLRKATKIGYESYLRAAFPMRESAASAGLDPLDLPDFREHPEHYTIVDVRNGSEVAKGKIFASAIPIPLPELQDRVGEIPTDKPVVVHCAGGYRSAIAASIVAARTKGVDVFDLSEAVKDFQD